MRKAFVLMLCLLTVTAVTAVTAAAAAQAPQRTLLHDGYGAYPRLIRIEHGGLLRDGRILASLTSRDDSGYYAPIYESRNDGRSFRKVGEVRDPEGRSGMCCGTLFELPRPIGDLPAGTLLWAASYRQKAGEQRRIGIRVWASRNVGRTWTFLSEPVRSRSYGGVWEPEFNVDARGTLWMHYADETEPGHSQVLNRMATTDLVHWGPQRRTMAMSPQRVRPGMPIVRPLPDGRYYFGYEICNYSDRFCDPYFKISRDGADFGDPSAPGTRIGTAGGSHFEHAQTVTVFPGGPTGTRLLMVGQIYVDARGEPLPGNGRTLLANDHLGQGPWYEVPAPVHVERPYDHPCPNYSSTLLPVDDGTSVLQVAADRVGGACRAFFATGPAY